MADLATFARRIRDRGEQTEDGVAEVMRKTFFAVHSQVVFATPVDTGRARGSWLPGLNVARTGEGTPERGGLAVLREGDAVGARLRVDNVGVIVNNVPYIGRLNNGSSRQAPANFVQQAVQTAAQTVRSTRIFDS